MLRFDLNPEAIRAFREQHPSKDGWIIFRIDPDSQAVFMPLLPAFLRAKHWDEVAKEDIWTDIHWSDRRRSTRISLTAVPHRVRGRGLEESAWFGDIELSWRGVPIHYRRLSTYADQGIVQAESSVTLLATKSRSALENFYGELVAFARRLPPRSEIFVINGANVPRPRMRWEDLILPGNMREDIRGNVEAFLKAKKQYKRLGLPYRRGFIFAGPPGCGKTCAAKVIAANTKVRYFALSLKSNTEDKDVERAFNAAASYSPSILLLEDLDRLAGSQKVSMSFLLSLLDGIESPQGLLIIATANHPEKLDAALLCRPSRFDRVWHFRMPGPEERFRMLDKSCRGRFSSETVKEAARLTTGFTMAYVQEAAVSALLKALIEGRAAADDDLLASVALLQKQLSSSRTVNGDIQTPGNLGFVLPEESDGATLGLNGGRSKL